MKHAVEIEKIVSGGMGLAHFRGKSVFIPFVLPGEKVEYTVKKEKNDYIVGTVRQIIEPSPLRVKPFCRYFRLCGGCQYQMTSYDKEIEFKRKVIIESFKRIAQVYFEQPFEIVPSLKEKNYRNRITLYRTRSGMWAYRKGESHKFVLVNTCPIAEQEINEKLAGYRPLKTSDYIFRSDYEGNVYVYRRGRKSQHQKKYREKISGILLPLAGEVFFQINRTLTLTWLDSIKEFITEQGYSGPIIELYSGSGLISLYLEKNMLTGPFYCYESDPLSIILGREALQLNNSYKIEIVNELAERISQKAPVIIVNPPRKGMSRKALMNMLSLKPEYILYSSCNADTLARDLRIMIQDGYGILRVRGFDFFPRTAHCEVVVILKREKYIYNIKQSAQVAPRLNVDELKTKLFRHSRKS